MIVVAIGAVLGTQTLYSLAWLLIRRLQRRRGTVRELRDGERIEQTKRVPIELVTGEIAAKEVDAVQEIHTMPGDELPPPIYELPSPSSQAELDSAVLPAMEGMLSRASSPSSQVDEEPGFGGIDLVRAA